MKRVLMYLVIGVVGLLGELCWAQVAVPCERCHTELSWQVAQFRHETTGYALVGKHSTASCKACHTRGYHVPLVGDACSQCHKDIHAGQMGQLCQTCHAPTAWRLTESGRAFALEEHRRSQFPLAGRHATIPCQECHLERREQSFSRANIACVNCHLKDYQSTFGGPIDHGALGYSTQCRQCHNPFKFKPAIPQP